MNADDIFQDVVTRQLTIYIRIALKKIFPEDTIRVFDS